MFLAGSSITELESQRVGFMRNFTRNIFSTDKTGLPLLSAPFYNYPFHIPNSNRQFSYL
jgi:hypothetical protein